MTEHPRGPAPEDAAPFLTGGVRRCLECGGPCETKGEFCSRACRDDFGNRRKRRGEKLYDLFMALRWDRENATRLGVWRTLNRMSSDFRAEDRAERDGRRSWRRPSEVLADRPDLKSVVVRVRAGR
jgi:predicted nucleic acid-binding Zn ribbon protein